MKKLFMYLLLLLPFAIASCGGDDKDEPQDPNQGNTVATDVSATTSVKTATISQMVTITFYEDYNYQYKLFVVNGNIHVLHSIRINGEWNSQNNNGLNHFGIKDVGKVNGISEITSKDVKKGQGITSNNISYLAATFQPNHGYVVIFTTEGGETKYLRIFTTNYTTDSAGALNTVTVQYQLF